MFPGQYPGVKYGAILGDTAISDLPNSYITRRYFGRYLAQ